VVTNYPIIIIWKCLRRVDWWRHRWRHVTSQCLKSSHSETRNRVNYPCGPFKQTLS